MLIDTNEQNKKDLEATAKLIRRRTAELAAYMTRFDGSGDIAIIPTEPSSRKRARTSELYKIDALFRDIARLQKIFDAQYNARTFEWVESGDKPKESRALRFMRESLRDVGIILEMKDGQ